MKNHVSCRAITLTCVVSFNLSIKMSDYPPDNKCVRELLLFKFILFMKSFNIVVFEMYMVRKVYIVSGFMSELIVRGIIIISQKVDCRFY